jgi:hypothetical protein
VHRQDVVVAETDDRVDLEEAEHNTHGQKKRQQQQQSRQHNNVANESKRERKTGK